VDLPRYIQIEPVGQCNLRCQMCPIQFRRDGPPYGPPAYMDFAKFCRLIDSFPRLSELHLQGLGEPMMHPRFFDMVSYAAGRGIQVTTNSNFTLLPKGRARLCIESGLAAIFVSIDGATAETYERIRVGSDFNVVRRNLELLVAARRQAGSARPAICVVMVIMRQNLEELPALVRMAHGLGADRMSVQHLCHDFLESTLPAHYKPMRTFVDEQTLLNEEPDLVAALFDQARATAQALSFELRLPNLRPVVHPSGTPGPQRCDWPWRGAYVSYDGKAMPCCMVATPDRINFGNMMDDSPDGVWNNAAYQSFRDQLASDEPPEICRSCAVYRGTF
jgi:radical SAM protein with 4Fe4S-binding SPASM domain